MLRTFGYMLLPYGFILMCLIPLCYGSAFKQKFMQVQAARGDFPSPQDLLIRGSPSGNVCVTAGLRVLGDIGGNGREDGKPFSLPLGSSPGPLPLVFIPWPFRLVLRRPFLSVLFTGVRHLTRRVRFQRRKHNRREDRRGRHVVHRPRLYHTVMHMHRQVGRTSGTKNSTDTERVTSGRVTSGRVTSGPQLSSLMGRKSDADSRDTVSGPWRSGSRSWVESR